MSYPGYPLEGFYCSAEMQLGYSTAPVNRAKKFSYNQESLNIHAIQEIYTTVQHT